MSSQKSMEELILLPEGLKLRKGTVNSVSFEDVKGDFYFLSFPGIVSVVSVGKKKENVDYWDALYKNISKISPVGSDYYFLSDALNEMYEVNGQKVVGREFFAVSFFTKDKSSINDFNSPVHNNNNIVSSSLDCRVIGKPFFIEYDLDVIKSLKKKVNYSNFYFSHSFNKVIFYNGLPDKFIPRDKGCCNYRAVQLFRKVL